MGYGAGRLVTYAGNLIGSQAVINKPYGHFVFCQCPGLIGTYYCRASECLH